MQDLITFFANHPGLSLAGLGILVLIFLVELIRAKRGATNITPAKATQLINKDHAIVLDLRKTEEYRLGHIIDAQSIPAEDIQKNPKKLEKFKGKPIILIAGATAGEAPKMAALMLQQGHLVYVLAGGMKAWRDAQMPVVKEQ